ncbi:MAG TPA: hypothetical protein VGH74_14920 [Planctomycetaceae bacterium]|jgi:hypothetical protein
MHLQEMVKNFDPEKLQDIFAEVAQKIRPQQYSDHVTPGVGGTNPLGNLTAGALGSIASVLVSRLKDHASSSASTSAPSSAPNDASLNDVPGLKTTDPRKMDAADVAAIARYAQEHRPAAFGQAATQIAQKQPGLLHSFLGKAVLALGAAALASHFIKPDHR